MPGASEPYLHHCRPHWFDSGYTPAHNRDRWATVGLDCWYPDLCCHAGHLTDARLDPDGYCRYLGAADLEQPEPESLPTGLRSMPASTSDRPRLHLPAQSRCGS